MEEQQIEMKHYFNELMDTILADGKVGLVPQLSPKFVDCDCNELSLTLEFVVRDWMINPEKILFGGALMSMFDNAYGFLCHYFAGENFISTISHSTVFLKSAMLGDTIQVKVKADSHGRTIVNMSGEAKDISSGKMIGTSQTSFMILNKTVTL